MIKPKLIYTSPRSELVALSIETPLLDASVGLTSKDNVDDCDKTSGLDFDDEGMWD